ncbi:MAG: cytochrome c oxidase subunit II [Ignavibacteria bacterium RBG_16_34_14]|nr:MAG: cytochrome c oxidase subunit II [Ignavibacteria bacterium RBG_16_34_14]
MFSGSSNFVESVDTAFWVVMVISVFFLVLITFLMVFFVIKYNKKRNPKAKNVHSNVPLEVTWTVIPTILVLIMFWYGWVGYKQMSESPEDSMVIDVTAQMWKWTFKYQNGVQSDTLYVPLKKNIRLNLHSLDVNHAFFVPAFRVKKDIIPNRNNHVWFNALEIGSYNIMCAEYCGLNHSNMYSKVVVIPEQNFNFWLENKGKLGTGSQQISVIKADTTASK